MEVNLIFYYTNPIFKPTAWCSLYKQMLDCCNYIEVKVGCVISRACIDASETGDLASCTLLASYREERQFASFSKTGMSNIRWHCTFQLKVSKLLNLINDNGIIVHKLFLINCSFCFASVYV